jgi:glycosyltransferase involved in cell wall biosynthesis
MKAVCILVQSVYDSDPRVRRKAEALAAAGYSVDVLALRPPDGRAIYTLNGVRVMTLALGKMRGSLARYAFEYAAFFAWAFVRLPLLMRKRRYAVIDVNTLPDFLVFAPIFARWMGAKIILDMHEITPEFYMSKYKMLETSWCTRILKFLEKISFDFADHVITINEPIQNLLVARGLPLRKSTIVMNAVDEARFNAASKSPAAAGALEAPGKFVMMYHGTLTRLYGLDLAIEAFSSVHHDMPEAELWVLGAGPEAGLLKDLARERGVARAVRLVGQVSAADIPSWLNRCDLGILPIRRDVFLEFAFPNKLSEFIITGKPVIISRLKAIRHYFTEDALLFFEPHDVSDLARQMLRAYQDAALRARVVARARQEYAPLCWDLMKHRYLTLVERLTGAGAERSPAVETSTAAGHVG